MKKWIALILVLALVAVMASACSGLTESTETQTGGTNSAAVSESDVAAAKTEVDDTLSTESSSDY